MQETHVLICVAVTRRHTLCHGHPFEGILFGQIVILKLRPIQQGNGYLTGRGRVLQTGPQVHGHQSPCGRRHCAGGLRPERHLADDHPQGMPSPLQACQHGLASKGCEVLQQTGHSAQTAY